jgi:hypothetical protein
MLDHQLARIEKGLSQQKSLLIAIERAGRGKGRRDRDPHVPLVRAFTCMLLGAIAKRSASQMAARLYPDDATVAEAAEAPGVFLARTIAGPAMTTVPTWAQELTTSPAPISPLAVIAPESAFSRLASRGLSLEFGAATSIRLPARSATGDLSGAWIGEGEMIPVHKATLSSGVLTPKKLGVISTFTRELAKASAPNAEAIVRQGMSDDTSLTIDAVLLGNAAATATTPSGLLNGISGIAATNGGGIAALAGDLGNLADSIPHASSRLTFIMNSATFIRANALSNIGALDVIVSDSVPSRTVLAVDAADFASAQGDADFSASQETVIVLDDAPAPPLGTQRTASAWQENLIGLRMILDVTWAMRRPGRVAYVEQTTW